MSNKKFRRGKKNDGDREKEIEDLEKSLKHKKWEYDFDVTNKYTFNDLFLFSYGRWPSRYC